MAKEKKEIVKFEGNNNLQVPNVQSLLTLAIEKNVPVETIERLTDLFNKQKAEWAKGEFNKAMAAFQAKCPIIKRKTAGGKTNEGDKPAYFYATLGQIIEETKKIMEENGLSYTILTDSTEKGIKATCVVHHIAGHYEQSTVEFPTMEGTRLMSAPQKVAATISLAKRYALCNAFGIVTDGEDDEKVLMEQRIEKLESFAFTKVKGDIEKATKPETVDKLLAILEKDAKALEENKTPSLGLTKEQYAELIPAAKSKKGTLEGGKKGKDQSELTLEKTEE